MKVTLGKVVEAYQALMDVGQTKMSAKLAYIFQRNIREIQKEVEIYEKVRFELISTKYGEKLEDGSHKVKDELVNEFTKELSELLASELDLDIRQININDIKFDISPVNLLQLDWIIIEEEEPKPEEIE